MVEDKEEKECVMREKFTDEITPIQAILPLVMEEIERKRKKYIEEQL